MPPVLVFVRFIFYIILLKVTRTLICFIITTILANKKSSITNQLFIEHSKYYATHLKEKFSWPYLMEILGFEPKTSCLQSKRATNCAKFPAHFYALRIGSFGQRSRPKQSTPQRGRLLWLRFAVLCYAGSLVSLAPHRGAKQAKSNQCSTVCHIIKNKK